MTYINLTNYLLDAIDKILAPLFNKFGFTKYEFETEAGHRAVTFKHTDGRFIHIDHDGFHVHDYPWQVIALLGKEGFKKTTAEFDTVPLWYIKQKIAPQNAWQLKIAKIDFENYPVNSETQIDTSIRKIKVDLERHCNDFLENRLARFDKIRQIKYLEYLVQYQLKGGEYWWRNNIELFTPDDVE